MLILLKKETLLSNFYTCLISFKKKNLQKCVLLETLALVGFPLSLVFGLPGWMDGGQGGGGRQLRELNLDRGVGAGKSHHVRTRAAGENLVLFAFPGFPKILRMSLFCGLRLIFSEQEMTVRL